MQSPHASKFPLLLLALIIIVASGFNPFISRRLSSPTHFGSASRAAPVSLPPRSSPLFAESAKPELTPSKIADMLEKTFVDACMQLSSGYVDVLKLFIVAGKAAYERGLTIPQVQLEITQCQTQTAGRALMQEEIDLRTVWLSLIYLTLERVEHRKGSSIGSTVDPDLRQKFYTFVYDVVNAKKQGYTLQTLKLEQIMKNSSGQPTSIAEKTVQMNAQQRQIEEAILSQSMRLVFLTLTVLEESEEFEKGNGNGNGGGGDNGDVPRPPIPGT